MKRFLKRVISQLLPAAALVLGMGACTDEDSPFNGGETPSVPQAGPKSYFVAFDIVTPSADSRSRATTWNDGGEDAADGDYVYGDSKENGIGTSGHYVFFFDASQRLQMVYPLSLPNKVDMKPDVDPGDKIEIKYWTLIRDIEEKDLPSWALVVLNGKDIYEQLVNDNKVGVSTVANVLASTWSNSTDPTKIGRQSDGLFTMTNTTYLKDGAVYCAVPVTKKMYHELEDKNELIPPQKVLEEDEILKVRVERMVGKVTFTMTGGVNGSAGSYIYTPEVKSSDDPDYFDYNHQVNVCTGWNHTREESSYTREDGQEVAVVTEDWEPVVAVRGWKAQVTGWDMNALEREEYIYKNINSASYDFFPGWNDQTYYRSFWAEDPGYGETEYPWQYRRAVNKDLTYYEKNYNGEGANTNFLANYSYDFLNKGNFTDPRYFPENTYDYTKLGGGSLDGRRDLLAGTHLIVCAKLLIEDDKGEFKAIDVYRDNRGIYYTTAKDCLWSLVRMFNYTLGSQERMRYQQYDWKASGDGTKMYAVPAEGSGNYVLYMNGAPLDYYRIMNSMSEDDCKAMLVAAEVKNGDGKRLFQSSNLTIQNASGAHLPLYTEYKLGADSETHLKYDNSEYFAGTTERNLDGTVKTEKNDIWSLLLEWTGTVDHFGDGLMYYPAEAKIQTDVWGVVRNGWYRYRLSAINSIGIPVDLSDQPIVPNWDVLYDGVNLTVQLIPWHEISGSLDILPNN